MGGKVAAQGPAQPEATEKAGGEPSAPGSLRREIAVAGLLVIGAVVAEAVLEHTRFAHNLAFASNRFFQSGLRSPATAPVAIVDISDLPPTGPSVRPITSRKALGDLLTAIVRHQPKAVGIDIDFSPDEHGVIDHADTQFFDFCLRLEKSSGVPIVLGVDRTTGAAAHEWLINDQYRSLPATIRIPHQPRHMPSAIAGPDGAPPLRSMSAALAAAYGNKNAESDWLARAHGAIAPRLQRIGLIRQFSRREDHGITFDEFLVDYSSIESMFIVRTVSDCVLGDTALDEPFEDKIVLIGDVRGASDRFPVVGRETLYPGVMLHGAAATTLIRGALYEVTPWGGIALTFILITGVLAPVFVVRAYARTRGKKLWVTARLQGTLIVVATILAIACGGYLVRLTHVMWDGFFLAFFALAFHQPVEDLLHSAARMSKRMRSVLQEEE